MTDETSGQSDAGAVDAAALEVELAANPTSELTFTGTKDPQGNGFTLDVTGVPNTNPSGGHFVAAWQADGAVPWGNLTGLLVGNQNVQLQSPQGTVPFMQLSLGDLSYVVAYSTGADAKTFNNVAAVMPFHADGTPGELQPTALTNVTVGSTGLSVDYTTPDGTDPLAQGHSLILAQTNDFIPGRGTIIATAQPTDSSSDQASFNLAPTPLKNGHPYTVAYLTGQKQDPNNKQNMIPDPATVAATIQFTVNPGAS